MLSKIPFDWEKVKEMGDAELVRIGLIAELDAVNLYEQLANLAKDELVKKVFDDIAKEEKEHIGEFLELLRRLDGEINEALEEGAEEVKEMEEG